MINYNDIIMSIKKVSPNTTISVDTKLLIEGVLDSLSLMNLAMQLNEDYGIEINIFDITPENFETVDSIAKLINSKIS